MGGSKKMLWFGGLLYLHFVIIGIQYFACIQMASYLSYAPIFLIPFAMMIFYPPFRAIKNPIGPNIGKAVKSGVIALDFNECGMGKCLWCLSNCPFHHYPFTSITFTK
jgi:hypothetical protein